MRSCDLFQHFKRCVLVCALVLSGCATTMQMSSEELQRVTPNEGIVVGSIQISGGKDILGRTTWELVAKSIKETSLMSSLSTSGFEYSVKASRDGEEEVFVTRMPAGDYLFWKLYQPKFSTFTVKTNIQFKVLPGKTTYIGKLVVEFPPEFLNVYTRIQLRVEDAKASALNSANRKYGLSGDDVITGLMTTREPN